ncbi:MAG: DUF5615 family PIN-like protein [Patescibacteria group bacterium]
MRFLIDVNIPRSVSNYLTNSGFDVIDIKTINLKMSDVDIVKLAKKEGSTILTLDKDFIILTQYPKYQVSTIVIRLKNLKSDNIIKYLQELLTKQDRPLLNNSLTILSEEKADSFEFK